MLSPDTVNVTQVELTQAAGSALRECTKLSEGATLALLLSPGVIVV